MKDPAKHSVFVELYTSAHRFWRWMAKGARVLFHEVGGGGGINS